MLKQSETVAPGQTEESDPEPAGFEAPSLAHLSRPKTAHVDVEPSPHHAGRHTNKLRGMISAGKPAKQAVDSAPANEEQGFVFVAKTFDPHQMLLDLADLHNDQRALNVVHFKNLERFIDFLHSEKTWVTNTGKTLKIIGDSSHNCDISHFSYLTDVSEQTKSIEGIVCLVNDIACSMFYDHLFRCVHLHQVHCSW